MLFTLELCLCKSQFVFKCNDQILEYTQKYTYLGLTLNEFLAVSSYIIYEQK